MSASCHHCRFVYDLEISNLRSAEQSISIAAMQTQAYKWTYNRVTKLSHSDSKKDAVHVRLHKSIAEQTESVIHVAVCPIYECLKISQDQVL